MRKYIIPALCSGFIICLIIFPKTAVSAALNGINLWFNIVFPSLFPFFAVSEMLHETGFIKSAGRVFEKIMRPVFNVPGCGSFALAMGISSGYPTGAKITSDLRLKGYVTKTEAERLLSFTNNSGPLFITGAVATGMLNSPELGIPLLLCHIFASFTVGILFRFYKSGRGNKNGSRTNRRIGNLKNNSRSVLKTGAGKKTIRDNRISDSCHDSTNSTSFGKVLGNAVSNSIMTILQIGGFIVLFSVIINLLIETGAISALAIPIHFFLKPYGISMESIKAVICGLIEITTGSSYASSAAGSAPALKLAALSFILGWSGLSVHSQVASIVAKTDISVLPYLTGKFLHGVISSIYTLIFVRAALPSSSGSGFPVPNLQPGFGLSFGSSFAASIVCLGALFAVYSILLFILSLFKQILRQYN